LAADIEGNCYFGRGLCGLYKEPEKSGVKIEYRDDAVIIHEIIFYGSVNLKKFHEYFFYSGDFFLTFPESKVIIWIRSGRKNNGMYDP
jgi:hypothetical protein